MPESGPWPQPFELNRLAHGPVVRGLVADAGARERIAQALELDRLDRLEAELEITPWLDGARVSGVWSADIEQTCGVTLEPLASALSGRFELKALPAGSPNAPQTPEEMALDPEAEDPPDILEDDRIDLGALVVEQLLLNIDPFPRKPGAVFDAPEPEQPPSPFAVLQGFKARPR
jgi:uncharacterized metal-binding protein YceD (DUF177 family)